MKEFGRRHFLKLAASGLVALIIGEEKISKIDSRPTAISAGLEKEADFLRELKEKRAKPSPTPKPSPMPSPTPTTIVQPTPEPLPIATPAEQPIQVLECKIPPLVGNVERPSWTDEELLRPISKGSDNKAQVALTFDDGWGHGEEIRQILWQKNVRSTFFFYGTAIQADPALVERLIADGNEIGNHTMNHAILTQLDEKSINDELANCEMLLQGFGQTGRPYFRPPAQYFNDRVLTIAADMGFRTILSTINPRDWREDSDPRYVKNFVLQNSGPGTIVLLHTQGPATYQVLPQIIDGLRCQKGLEPVSLSNLLAT